MPIDWWTSYSWWLRADERPPLVQRSIDGRAVRFRSRPGPLVGLPLLEDLPDVAGRRVLVRVDYNVPLDHEDGLTTVADDFRIRTTLPTLHWLQERGASVTVCSHLGRPDGVPDERWSMEPVRERLAEICPGVELMDNLRFEPGEKANSPAFVDRLVAGFDVKPVGLDDLGRALRKRVCDPLERGVLDA